MVVVAGPVDLPWLLSFADVIAFIDFDFDFEPLSSHCRYGLGYFLHT